MTSMDLSEVYEDEDKFFNDLDQLIEDLFFPEVDSFDFVRIIKNYSEHEFKQNFRLKRSTILELISTYKLYNSNSPKKLLIDVELEIYAFIWYLSNNLTLREIANLFRVQKIVILKAVYRVSKYIVNRYSELLQWPNHEECLKNSLIFEHLTKIPNVIGIMDVVHIRIKAPQYNSQDYLNDRRFFSVTAQVIVDASMKFINVYCNEPGSFDDNRILKNSPIYLNCLQNTNYFPPNTFILGQYDRYPVKPWLISPFRDIGNLTLFEKQFNHLHYGAGKMVKDAVDQVMFRFRKLLNFTEWFDIKFLINIIQSAFILHNVCIMKNDSYSELISNPFEESNLTDSSRRQMLIQELLFKNIVSRN